MAACTALELAHTATLIHDDVIDRARTRRGYESVASLLGNDMAMLLGNLITERAHQIALKASPAYDSELSCALIEVNRAQALEYLSRGKKDRTIAEYLEVCLGKTSAMISLGLRAGVISDDILEPNQGFIEAASHLGVAFQIVDDCEDFEISMTGQEFRSKHAEQDLDLANYTLPFILAENDGHGILGDGSLPRWETYLSQAMSLGHEYLESAILSASNAKASTPQEKHQQERLIAWLHRVSESIQSQDLDSMLQDLKTGGE